MRFSFTKEQVPVVLTSVCVALGPLMIAGARCNWNGLTLAAIVLVALVSDIYDDVLARRWHCDTAAVRLYDSMADQVFYVCTGVGIWMDRREVLTNNGWLLMALLGAEALRYVVDFTKYRGGIPMAVSFALGIVCNVETLAMSAMLPAKKRDVPTLRAAWKLRALDYCGLERNDSCA
jgi:phosphatidylglycerophosphate synthase